MSLKSLVEQEEIGTVLEMRYYGKQDPRVGGEDLIVLGSHDMDIMRFLFGDPLWCFASVTAGGSDVTADDIGRGLSEPYSVAGDTIRAQYAFNNNIQIYWSSVKTDDFWNKSSRIEGDPVEGREKWGFDMFGTKGYLYYRSGFGIKIFRSSWLVPGDSSLMWQDIPQIPASELPVYKTHPIRNLIHAIETDTEPACTARDARWAIEMVMAVYWSQKAKSRVILPLEERGHPLDQWK
jgi:predicted dehydrogenase